MNVGFILSTLYHTSSALVPEPICPFKKKIFTHTLPVPRFFKNIPYLFLIPYIDFSNVDPYTFRTRTKFLKIFRTHIVYATHTLSTGS